MSQLTTTPAETGAALVTEAVRLHNLAPSELLRLVANGMAAGHRADYAECLALHTALDTRMDAMWSRMSTLIGTYLACGGDYADLPKPPFIMARLATGGMRPVNVPFPVDPLSVWSFEAADEAALAALAGGDIAAPTEQGATDILAALAAAQPEA